MKWVTQVRQKQEYKEDNLETELADKEEKTGKDVKEVVDHRLHLKRSKARDYKKYGDQFHYWNYNSWTFEVICYNYRLRNEITQKCLLKPVYFGIFLYGKK